MNECPDPCRALLIPWGPNYLQPALYDIIDIFSDSKRHNPNADFHHLAAVIFNVTQVRA